ncbi:MFS transporter [Selenomonas sp. TAMA-11512]|uniref:MFS transporter n=1 Tax=Selenomonas sp. TAMA-11512 TaxID=3095337 RepID=UPI0030907917|nr:MFS transporter [Selenomonas sp. TAMA-11512]
MPDNRKIYFIVLMTNLMGPFMGSSVNIAIPTMAVDFGISPEKLSWILTAYLLGSVMLLLPAGRLADMFGRRKLYTLGSFSVAAATGLCAVAPDAGSLTFFRLLQGLSFSMVASTGMAMLVASFGKAERGRVLGAAAAATYIGLSLGPVLGGVIVEVFSWRILFLGTSLFNLAAALLISTVRQEWRGEAGDGFDFLGAVLYSAASGSLLYGVSAFHDVPHAPAMVVAGVVLLSAFFLRERRVLQRCKAGAERLPILDLSLFSSRIFLFSNLAAFMNYAATYASAFMMSLCLQIVYGFDAKTAGFVLLSQPILMAAFSPIAGRLSDKYPPRWIASAGMGVTTVGLFCMAQPAAMESLAHLVVSLFLMGLGFAFFASPNTNAIMSAAPQTQYGTASSLTAVMRQAGQAMSMAITTALLSLFIAPGTDYASSLAAANGKIFLALTGAGIAAVIFSVVRGRTEDAGK